MNAPDDTQRLRIHDAIMTEQVLQLEKQIDALRAAVKAAPTWPQWTRVEDKLPDADLTVLLALDDGEVWPGYLDGDEWRYVTSDPLGSRVVAWMDLPEGPENAKVRGPEAALSPEAPSRLPGSTPGDNEERTGNA